MKRSFFIITSLLILLLLAGCQQAQPSHVHFFEKWNVLLPATCTENGKEQSACACGAVEIREIPAAGAHSFGEWQASDATCAASGKETRSCACGASETRTVSATGAHSFGEWQTTTIATCATKGKEKRSCACGASETRTIPATGAHSFGEWQTTTAATCGTDGEQTRECACGASEHRSLSATGVHSYDAENTCTSCGDYMDKGVVFTVLEECCIVSDYTGSAVEVILPSRYRGKPVVAIGAYAFYLCTDLARVTVPYTVQSIGEYAFAGEGGSGFAGQQGASMALARISFAPSGCLTEIGDGAFAYCASLVSVCIPASVTSVGCEVFYGCDALEAVYFTQSDGWSRAHVYFPGNLQPVGADILGDPALAAEQLKTTWRWTRAV